MENVGIFYSQLDFLGQFCIFNGHLVIFWLFGILSAVLVYCVKKNLAALAPAQPPPDYGVPLKA
jgi:hypothetical protein